MKYCSNCGSQVEENDVYCGYCGSKLKEEESHQESAYARQDFQEESIAGADFSEDFGKEYENEFDRGDGFDNGHNERHYVEREGFSDQSSTDCNASRPEHKQLLHNKDAKDANTYGILALIFGILGGILGIVFGILGLMKSKKALELCNTGEYDGKSNANNGKTLSIIGIVLGAISIIFWLF